MDIMDATRDIWVGTLNGIAVVFDPRIQVQESRWVVLYAVPHKRLIPYQRSHARSVTHPCEDAELRRAAMAAYEAWRRATPESVLEAAAADIRHKDEVLARKLAQVIVTHRRRLEEHSRIYRGTTEPDGRGHIRNASCRECHRAIGSDTHLVCNACGWIICSSCGTCGC
jgi:hypothetical protein